MLCKPTQLAPPLSTSFIKKIRLKCAALRCDSNGRYRGGGLSNPHLSSKAAKSRASRMFSSGSHVLYLRANDKEERTGVCRPVRFGRKARRTKLRVHVAGG